METQFELPLGKSTLGSGPKCTIRLSQADVQPLHCLLTRDANGVTARRWAEPLLVNGQPFESVELSAGDLLTVGLAQLEVVGEHALSEPDLCVTDATIEDDFDKLTATLDDVFSPISSTAAVREIEEIHAELKPARQFVDRQRSRRLLHALRAERDAQRQLANELANLEQRFDAVLSALEAAKRDHQTAQLQLDEETGELRARNERLTGEVTALKNELATLGASCRVSAETNSELIERCQQLAERNSRLADDMARLTAERDSQAKQHGQPLRRPEPQGWGVAESPGAAFGWAQRSDDEPARANSPRASDPIGPTIQATAHDRPAEKTPAPFSWQATSASLSEAAKDGPEHHFGGPTTATPAVSYNPFDSVLGKESNGFVAAPAADDHVDVSDRENNLWDATAFNATLPHAANTDSQPADALWGAPADETDNPFGDNTHQDVSDVEPIVAEQPPQPNWPATSSAESLFAAKPRPTVEDVPAAAEPTSYIARFGHMFADDEGGNAAEPAPAISSAPVGANIAGRRPEMAARTSSVDNTTNSASDEEESIEEYMAKLLQRVRGEVSSPPASQAPAAPATQTAAGDKSAHGQHGPLPFANDAQSNADATSEMDDRESPKAEFIWAPAVSDRPAGYQALRDLANQSARQAIAVHASKTYRRSTVTKVIVSVLAAMTSLWLMLLAPDWRDMQFISAGVLLFVAAYWGGQSFSTLLESVRAGAYDGPDYDADEDILQGAGPLPIDIDQGRW